MRKPAIVVAIAILAIAGASWLAWRGGPEKPAPVSHNSDAAPSAPVSIAKLPVLTPAVAALLSTEPVPLAGRLNLLRAVGDNLPAADRQALLDSIGNDPPNGLSVADWHSLANDILESLRRQHPYTPGYTDRLLALWHDRTLDPTLRDYALQQLREWVADGDSRTAHEPRLEKIALIQQAFLDAATPGHPDCDPLSTTTGTALLALDEWANSSHSEIDNPQSSIVDPASSSFRHLSASDLQHLLLAHAANPAAHRGLRATALQLCARRGVTDALPVARTILADTSSEAILQMCAISLIGVLGRPSDLALLQDFQQRNSNDPILQAALQKAVQTLSAENRQSLAR